MLARLIELNAERAAEEQRRRGAGSREGRAAAGARAGSGARRRRGCSEMEPATPAALRRPRSRCASGWSRRSSSTSSARGRGTSWRGAAAGLGAAVELVPDWLSDPGACRPSRVPMTTPTRSSTRCPRAEGCRGGRRGARRRKKGFFPSSMGLEHARRRRGSVAHGDGPLGRLRAGRARAEKDGEEDSGDRQTASVPVWQRIPRGAEARGAARRQRSELPA